MDKKPQSRFALTYYYIYIYIYFGCLVCFWACFLHFWNNIFCPVLLGLYFLMLEQCWLPGVFGLLIVLTTLFFTCFIVPDILLSTPDFCLLRFLFILGLMSRLTNKWLAFISRLHFHPSRWNPITWPIFGYLTSIYGISSITYIRLSRILLLSQIFGWLTPI